MGYELMRVRGVSNHYGARDTGGSDGSLPSAGRVREMLLTSEGPAGAQAVLFEGWAIKNDVTGITAHSAATGQAVTLVADTAVAEDVVLSANSGSMLITVEAPVAANYK